MSITSVLKPLLSEHFQYQLHCANYYYQYQNNNLSHAWIKSLVASLKYFFRPNLTILFYPEYPERGMADFHLTVINGYAISNHPNKCFDIAFKREDSTLFNALVLQKIPCDQQKILNAKSVDISKHNIAVQFEAVFGYPLEVDATQYEGDIVQKSNDNATHDGCIVTGPLSAEQLKADQVYQKIIDNTWSKEGFVLDQRVPIHGDKIPLVYLKYRKESERFLNANDSVTLETPENVFSEQEIKNLIALAKKIGIDFGEFDVLRDKDQRIYVVDINNTPFGPPNGLPEADAKQALKIMANTYAVMLEQWRLDKD